MKTVQAITGYKDMQLGRYVNKNEEFEVDDKRAEQLISAGVASIKENATEVTPALQYDLNTPQKTEETFKDGTIIDDTRKDAGTTPESKESEGVSESTPQVGGDAPKKIEKVRVSADKKTKKSSKARSSRKKVSSKKK